uniref:Uncharacterized protein n=1 Tax=Grammatophora oceanica TaxID=210454 RepID=A0A7S1XZ55_9STRA
MSGSHGEANGREGEATALGEVNRRETATAGIRRETEETDVHVMQERRSPARPRGTVRDRIKALGASGASTVKAESAWKDVHPRRERQAPVTPKPDDTLAKKSLKSHLDSTGTAKTAAVTPVRKDWKPHKSPARTTPLYKVEKGEARERSIRNTSPFDGDGKKSTHNLMLMGAQLAARADEGLISPEDSLISRQRRSEDDDEASLSVQSLRSLFENNSLTSPRENDEDDDDATVESVKNIRVKFEGEEKKEQKKESAIAKTRNLFESKSPGVPKKKGFAGNSSLKETMAKFEKQRRQKWQPPITENRRARPGVDGTSRLVKPDAGSRTLATPRTVDKHQDASGEDAPSSGPVKNATKVDDASVSVADRVRVLGQKQMKHERTVQNTFENPRRRLDDVVSYERRSPVPTMVTTSQTDLDCLSPPSDEVMRSRSPESDFRSVRERAKAFSNPASPGSYRSPMGMSPQLSPIHQLNDRSQLSSSTSKSTSPLKSVVLATEKFSPSKKPLESVASPRPKVEECESKTESEAYDDGVTLDLSIAEVSVLTNPTCLQSKTDTETNSASRGPREIQAPEATDGEGTTEGRGPSEASSSQASEAAAPLIALTMKMQYAKSDDYTVDKWEPLESSIDESKEKEKEKWKERQQEDRWAGDNWLSLNTSKDTQEEDDAAWDLRNVMNSFPKKPKVFKDPFRSREDSIDNSFHAQLSTGWTPFPSTGPTNLPGQRTLSPPRKNLEPPARVSRSPATPRTRKNLSSARLGAIKIPISSLSRKEQPKSPVPETRSPSRNPRAVSAQSSHIEARPRKSPDRVSTHSSTSSTTRSPARPMPTLVTPSKSPTLKMFGRTNPSSVVVEGKLHPRASTQDNMSPHRTGRASPRQFASPVTSATSASTFAGSRFSSRSSPRSSRSHSSVSSKTSSYVGFAKSPVMKRYESSVRHEPFGASPPKEAIRGSLSPPGRSPPPAVRKSATDSSTSSPNPPRSRHAALLTRLNSLKQARLRRTNHSNRQSNDYRRFSAAPRGRRFSPLNVSSAGGATDAASHQYSDTRQTQKQVGSEDELSNSVSTSKSSTKFGGRFFETNLQVD